MPGNHPEVRINHSEHDRSLKSRIFGLLIQDIFMMSCLLWQCVVFQVVPMCSSEYSQQNPICPGFMGFKELCAIVPQNLFWDTKCPWVLPSCKNTTFLNI